MYGQTAMCKCNISFNKTTYVSKLNSIEKARSNVFDCARWISLQSLICTIRLSKVCFRRELQFGKYFFDQLEAIFLANVYAYNKKPLLHSRNLFLLSIGALLVGKAGFSLTHGKQKNFE